MVLHTKQDQAEGWRDGFHSRSEKQGWGLFVEEMVLEGMLALRNGQRTG